MDFSQIALISAAAVAAGFLNVVAGGGSLLTMSALMLFGMDGAVANGSNRVGICAQNIFAIAAFRRGGIADFRLSLTFALCALPGAVAGAIYGSLLTGGYNYLLAAVMIAVMVLMAIPSRHPTKGSGEPRNVVLGHLLMVGAGAYGGFIQAGVGFILMPILNKVMGLDLVRTNVHKVIIVMVYTPVSLATKSQDGRLGGFRLGRCETQSPCHLNITLRSLEAADS